MRSAGTNLRPRSSELDRWADDILADGAFFGSHEDVIAARQ